MDPQSPNRKKATIHIAGMTCASCELLLERKLKEVPGVINVNVHHKGGIAVITASADTIPDGAKIEAVIREAGYSIVESDGEGAAAPHMPDIADIEPAHRKWMEIGAAFLIIFALYKVLQTFDLVSLAPATTGALTFGGVFLIGLVAGTSSCLAVTGGLLLSVAAKYNEAHSRETPREKLKPLLHFNVGRLAGYFVLGGLMGIVGQSFTLSAKTTGYLNILIAFVMLYLALTILHIIPKGSCPIRPPRRLTRAIARLEESKNPLAPFALGAGTFFLPCGFTQSLQLVALASASFLSGALTMGIFALGTLPSLLGISFVSSHAEGTASRLFLRFAGSLVLILALFNLNSGFALTGINLSRALRSSPTPVASAPPVNGNNQEIFMRVGRFGYEPNELTVRAGIPVKWTIDGTEARGCTSILSIPSMNYFQPLTAGNQTIEFTPASPGYIAFSCSMGMVRGTINVI